MKPERPYSRRERRVAVLVGIVCHVGFLIGIGAMMAGIYTGMGIGLGPFTGAAAWIANGLLLLQFPIVHSFLLSARGRTILIRLAPAGLGEDLLTTTYAITASLQLCATFLLWSPSGAIWWRASGAPWVASSAVYGLAWLVLLKTMVDAGLAVQTGFLGWSAVARGRRPQFSTFRVRGTFAFVRQPVYVAFALTLWTAPVWTPDRLLLALGWSAYCVAGPLLKERRYLRYHGEAFAAYRRRVPYWLPRLRPAPLTSAS
jgi:protein-S-isoprenylcysteine O-methyltransferase Ste14